ncbi:uncharacterized protein TRAVEDRAFT_75397 [Trametes versicolor FP-101664 SS1]|uniref:uncharacterized protein n=1 Tax=Trametes versicolor (strain FP-101664) TaxID=717944 RepID=UPI0004621622|nr:uncharacterized protein TRAVEDRAFT_75397 [Trametes versicolor FP-101664 SS1]EIW52441.1 hypothetical protein TRAVEDRAFT_75397 [Trametes versicolor FP-101664 SS1]
MPVLTVAAQPSDGSTGSSNTSIVVGVLIPVIGLILFIVFGRKLWGRMVRRVRSWASPSPAPIPSPTMNQGGVTYPTSTPRRWKSSRKISTEGSVYGGVHGDQASPPPSPGAPSQYTRSSSIFSGASGAGHDFAVLSVPPAAHTA